MLSSEYKSIVFNAVQMAKIFLLPKLRQASIVVDATAGNGNDTLFLAQNTPLSAKILAFDIQEKAITNTRKLLKENNILSKVDLVLDTHVNISSYLKSSVDVVMFNLGYLPSSDHLVYTKPDTTIRALVNLLPLLNKKGLVTIIAYPGYKEGLEEMIVLEDFIKTLNQMEFSVACFKMLNQKNDPPALYIIEKLKS